MALPIWQRGHRVHGYRIDGHRVGYVGLSPRGHDRVYSWGIDADPAIRGEQPTLRSAKRRVEISFRRLYLWRFPESRDRQIPGHLKIWTEIVAASALDPSGRSK